MSKKLWIIGIIVAYVVALTFSVAYVFTLSNVNVEYSFLSGGIYATAEHTETNQILNKYKGKNLLFLDVEEIETELKANSKLEILELEKAYPNTLKVKIKQRQPLYAFKVDEKYAIIDEYGYVLELSEEKPNSREFIVMNVLGDKLVINSANVGEKIDFNDNALVNTVFDMAKEIDLFNCIKTISIRKDVNNIACFETYTGVTLFISDVDNLSKEKITLAYQKYNDLENDYIKSFGTIILVNQQEGLHADHVDRSLEEIFNEELGE